MKSHKKAKEEEKDTFRCSTLAQKIKLQPTVPASRTDTDCSLNCYNSNPDCCEWVWESRVENSCSQKTCTYILRVALFIIVNTEATKTHFSRMECYSVVKTNELSSHEKVCKKLKCIKLSGKKSQSKKL